MSTMTILGIDLDKSNERERLVLTPISSSGGGTGEPGPQGPAGPQGIPGEKGDTGAQGVQGVPGLQGPQGLKGDTGTQGVKGDTGAQGVQGPQGAKGDPGAQGIRGGRWFYSEAANPDYFNVANPIEGDLFLYPESRDFFQYKNGEWLYGSNIGAIKGDPGSQGPQGIQGPKGDTGAQGIQGPKGDTGATGPAGPAGAGGSYTDIPVVMSDGSSFTARKFTGSNLVVWFGQLVNNTGASVSAGTTLGTLPEGVRPRGGMRLALSYTSPGVSEAAIAGNIRPNMTFGFVGSMPTGATVHMGGVSYIAEG